MLATAELMPRYFPHTAESLMLSLDVRALGADAADETKQALGDDPITEQQLDPVFHADQAEEAVRKLVLDPYLCAHLSQQHGMQWDAAAGAEAQQRPLGVIPGTEQLPPLPPSPELYAKLMSVFDAAGLPLRVADLALRVLAAELPICVSSSLGTADGGGDASPASGTLKGGVLAVVADAMRLSNEASLYRVSTLLFQEALLRGGDELCHAGVVEQVRRTEEGGVGGWEGSGGRPNGGMAE